MTDWSRPQQLRPFLTRSVATDSPHDGATELAMADGTQGLLTYAAVSKRQWFWPYPDDAAGPISAHDVPSSPRAEITAINTWTDFELGPPTGNRVPFEMPWRMTEGITIVNVVVTLCTNKQYRWSLRLSAQSLIDAAATVDGKRRHGLINNTKPVTRMWANLNHFTTDQYRTGVIYSSVAPNIPANRRIKLVPQIQLAYKDNPMTDLGLGATIKAHMIALRIAEQNW